ncbi:MAG: amidohydrolase family protein [Deltaproteobacteria bacterium]|nr:amidohydrolase family protein [Deltaproteobacteria bacterium]
MSRRTFLLGLLGTSLGACAGPVIRTPGEEIEKFPLVDAHSHYGAVRDPMGEDLIEAMSAAGIKRMVLFEASDRGAKELARRFPGRFAPSYQGPMGIDRRREQMKYGMDAQIAEQVGAEYEKALRSGLYKGLGEIPTYHGARPVAIAPHSPLVLRLLELADQYRVPINIHCTASEGGAGRIDQALRSHPQTVVVWAHAGSYLSPASIRDFLRDHPNLYFDLSTLHPPWPVRGRTHLAYSGVIDESWRQLLESYPDRFLVGFDFGPGASGAIRSTPLSLAREVGEFFRTVLTQLTPPTARKFAYENAEKLYKFQ